MAGETGAGEILGDRSPWRRQVRAFARRAIRRFARNRAALFWAIVAPVGFYLFYGVFNTAGSDHVGATRAVMAPAFGIFGALSATLMVFSGNLGTDLREKRYRKLRSLPVAPSADLAGRFVAGFAVGAASFCSVLVVGVATGATVSIRGPASLAVVAASVFLFCLVGVSLGVISAAFVQDGQYLMVVGNALLLGLLFVTGYNGINPEMLPAALHPVVNVFPNSLATRLTLVHLAPDAATGGWLSPPSLPTGGRYVLLLAVEAVGLSVAAAVALRRAVYEWEVDE